MKSIFKFVSLFLIVLHLFCLFISCKQEVDESPRNYTVSYKTDYTIAPESIKVSENSVLSEKELPVLTDNNHRFLGWYIGETKAEAGKYKVTKDITLEAKWDDIYYTVSFNSLGGSEVENQKVKRGKKAFPPQNPTKAVLELVNYTFLGWYTSTDEGNTLSEQQFDFETEITSDIILYAKWSEELIYFTVTYNSEYGTVPTSIKVQVNTVLNSEQLPNITAAGQTFSGWFDGNIKAEANTYIVTKNTVLTAKWNVVTHTITYQPNNGNEVFTQVVTHSSKLTEPNIPTKSATISTSYTFAGWFTSSDNGTTLSNTAFDFTNTTITAPVTLYAKWTENPVYYTVTFNSKGGSGITSQTVRGGEKATLPVLSPTKATTVSTSYTFAGWFTSSDNGTTLSNTAFDFVNTSITAPITLYAKWTETAINYTVNFDSKGGTTVASIQVRGGNKLTAPTTPLKTATVSTNYTFAGWFTSTNNGATLSNTAFDFANTTITSPITLYAKWTETPVYYTVTFDSKGGSSVDSLELRWGDTITKPSDPTKEQFGLTSYIFVNWYTSSDNGITLSNTAFDFINTTITSSITLYAKWTETQSEYQFHETVEYLPRYTDGSAGTSGKYILFGDWPQTIKAANVSVNENQSMTRGDFTYYKGSDGYWYVKCTENASASTTAYSDGTTVANVSANSSKYFKVEPIKWRILNPKATDTEKKLLLAETILTPYRYAKNETSGQGKNYYQYSEIRTYLKTTFFNEAFSTNAQNLIANTYVDNSARSTNPDSNATLWNNGKNPKACPNQYDKIFLLSMQEVTKSAYGFAEYNKKDITRIRVPTDYAKANGCGWHDSQTSVGYSYDWWLRSPYYDSTVHVHEIDSYGSADTGAYAHYDFVGVVPALCLN